MTYSKAKIEAYAALDAAVEGLRKVYADEDPEGDNSVLTGYVLVTSSIEFQEPDIHDSNKDDLDTRSLTGWYSRRGQDPTLSYGILNEAVRHYNDVNAGGE